MSKLLKLKKWLTIPDAAKYLTGACEEDVTEADVLRFALDGQLKLSIQLVNGAYARSLRKLSKVDLQNLKYERIIGLDGKLGPTRIIGGLTRGIGGGAFQISEYVSPLEAEVWDLPLFIEYENDNAARLDIEHKYQMLTGGAAVTAVNIDGNVLVANTQGGLYELQEDFDDNEYQAGSSAQLEKLKRQIANNCIGALEAEELMQRHEKERNKFIEKRNLQPAGENYYPTDRLPKDSVLVVRTSAIQEFLESTLEPDKPVEKPLGNRERETLLTIIGVLAKEAKIDITETFKAGGVIESMAALDGVTLLGRTVGDHLKRVPEILKSRRKL